MASVSELFNIASAIQARKEAQRPFASAVRAFAGGIERSGKAELQRIQIATALLKRDQAQRKIEQDAITDKTIADMTAKPTITKIPVTEVESARQIATQTLGTPIPTAGTKTNQAKVDDVITGERTGSRNFETLERRIPRVDDPLTLVEERRLNVSGDRGKELANILGERQEFGRDRRSKREEQAIELGIDPDPGESIEQLETRITAKTNQKENLLSLLVAKH